MGREHKGGFSLCQDKLIDCGKITHYPDLWIQQRAEAAFGIGLAPSGMSGAISRSRVVADPDRIAPFWDGGVSRTFDQKLAFFAPLRSVSGYKLSRPKGAMNTYERTRGAAVRLTRKERK